MKHRSASVDELLSEAAYLRSRSELSWWRWFYLSQVYEFARHQFLRWLS
jgi:hypothetical protein